jgi:hypothetical protein
LSEDHRKTKREIAEKVGILTKKSINRNILQALDNSPLKKLEKLYNALQQSAGEFTFEQNLLNAPKALDSKVENSMQKVVDCKWENIDVLIQIADFSDGKFLVCINAMSRNAAHLTESPRFGKYRKDLDGEIEFAKDTNKKIKSFEPIDKSLYNITRPYTKIFGCREQCIILLNKIK